MNLGLTSMRFKDFITLQRGYDLPSSEREPGEYPVIASTSINGYHSAYKVLPPCVVTGRSGSLGSVQYVDVPCWPLNTTLWVKDFKGNHPRYVYYFLQTLGLEKYNAGAGVPTLNRNHLDELQLRVHSVTDQMKIAATLSAYDELIENNTRRIRILEQIARDLYQEWFVRFRFPGHESVEMVDSGTEYGLIPRGWEIKRFNDVSTNFDSRRIPLSSMKRAEMQGIYPYYGAAKILDYINDFLFEGRFLLVAEDGSVITPQGNPVLQLANGRFWVNNHTHVIQGKVPISTEYLYLALSEVSISGYITGAAQPKITQENLNRIPVIAGSSDVHGEFDDVVSDVFAQISLLDQKNTVLRETRDLLLPRLISGELDVSELDIDVPEPTAAYGA